MGKGQNDLVTVDHPEIIDAEFRLVKRKFSWNRLLWGPPIEEREDCAHWTPEQIAVWRTLPWWKRYGKINWTLIAMSAAPTLPALAKALANHRW